MKKILIFQTSVLLFLLPLTGISFADIQSSKHNFLNKSWNTEGEICLPCHTPHNADTTLVDSPLWNHNLSAATYTLYDSSTMIGTPEQPRSGTRACLSCHDGTIALDSYGGTVGDNYINVIYNIGTDLSNDHPVSIKWQHQNDIGNETCLNCHSLHPAAFISELPFFDGYVECSSCHDVHNGTAYTKLLRKPIQNSEICLHCHGK